MRITVRTSYAGPTDGHPARITVTGYSDEVKGRRSTTTPDDALTTTENHQVAAVEFARRHLPGQLMVITGTVLRPHARGYIITLES